MLLSFVYMFTYDAVCGSARLHDAGLRPDVEGQHVPARTGQARLTCAASHDDRVGDVTGAAARIGTSIRLRPTPELGRTRRDAAAASDRPGRLPGRTLTAADTGRRLSRPSAAAGPGLARVARGGALNLGGALISAIASARPHGHRHAELLPPVAGAFFVAMSLFLIVEAVANLGAYNGTIYFIARLRVLHAERRIPAIMRATIVPVVISSIVAAIAVIIFAQPLAGLLIDGRTAPRRQPGAVASALRALAVALPFAALTDTLLGAARGYHEMRPTVIVDRIGRSGLQALGVLAAALAGSSALLAPAWALPYVGASIAALFWLRRIMRRPNPADRAAPGWTRHARPRGRSAHGRPPGPGVQPVIDNRHGKPNAKGFWRFTGPRSLASIAQIVIQRLDIVLVGVLDRSGRGRDLHGRDPVPGRGPARQRGDQHGRPAAVHQAVRGRRPGRRQRRLPGHDRAG